MFIGSFFTQNKIFIPTSTPGNASNLNMKHTETICTDASSLCSKDKLLNEDKFKNKRLRINTWIAGNHDKWHQNNWEPG